MRHPSIPTDLVVVAQHAATVGAMPARLPARFPARTRALAVVPLACAVLFSACSAVEPFEPAVLATTAYDPAVTDRLPIGPHDVNLVFSIGGETGATDTKISGYLNLPRDYDLRHECAFELSGVEQTRDGTSHTYEFKKAAGGPAWRRLVETTSLELGDQVGQWFAGDDPAGPAPVLLFPPLLLGDIAGGDYWCNLRRIDQVASLTNPDTGLLTWDNTRFAEVVQANTDAWLVGFLTAGGLSGKEFDRTARMFSEMAQPTYSSFLGNMELSATRDEKAVTFVANTTGTDRQVFLTVEFTPTDARTVDAVIGVQTYFEQLAAASKQDRKMFREEVKVMRGF